MSNETNPVVGLVVPAGAFAFPRERIRFDREQVAAATAALHRADADFVEFGDSRVDQDVESAVGATPTLEFVCPVDSNECQIRRRCTNACGAHDALGATPTVDEMTADLGKLTLPEVIFVKDCKCASRPRFSAKAGDPTCEECGKAWTRTYGPSNDSPPEVQIEIRAAELAHRPTYEYTDAEFSGWDDHDHDDVYPETDEHQAGWLSAFIEGHPDDGQFHAVIAAWRDEK